MSQIKTLTAREILDSRGQPTLEVMCELANGAKARAGVPAGASTGRHEAVERRDGDPKRYRGRGVLGAVKTVNTEIAASLAGSNWEQGGLDAALLKLDGTPNKDRLGANALLGVSLAFARAVAGERGVPLYHYFGALAGQTIFKLPEPAFNVLNGGQHADSGLEWQEFMIWPLGFKTFKEKVAAAAEVISRLKDLLRAQGLAVSLGDEGGFAPKLGSNEAALDLLVEAITASGYSGAEIKIGLDVAAGDKVLPAEETVVYYESLAERYPICSIEDGFGEDDWAGFALLRSRLGGRLKIVGDDLTVTNVERIKEATRREAVNSVLIKPNQIGTVTETLAAIKLTKENGWSPFASHRSGETNDDFIADLAVGAGCDFIKAGSLARGERVAKYNRLVEIEEELGLC